LSNEMVVFKHLRDRGFAVESVRYPLDAFGEFVTVVVSPRPSPELVEAAMDIDKRTKIVIATDDDSRVLRDLGTYDFHAVAVPYRKRGERRGDRIGLCVVKNEVYDFTEL